MTHEVPAFNTTNVVCFYFNLHAYQTKIPCFVLLTGGKNIYIYIFCFTPNMGMTVPESWQIREDYGAETKWGKNPWKKQKRKTREWAWWESYSSGTRNILVQGCQSNMPSPSHSLPHTRTRACTLPFCSMRVQMHLEESKQHQKAQNPKCMSVYVCVWGREKERKREPRCFLALASLSLPARLVGCLRAVDVCTLLWLVPDVLHWPKSPRQ